MANRKKGVSCDKVDGEGVRGRGGCGFRRVQAWKSQVER